MNSLVTWVNLNLTSFSLEIVFVSVQDRCTVCAKCIIGLDIVFNTPMVLLGDVGQVECRFGLLGASVGAR